MANDPVNANDPSGEALNLLTGAGGAVIGGIGGAFTGYVKSGGDWGKTIKSAGLGAFLGGVTGLTFGAGTPATLAALTARGAGTGVVASAFGSAAGQFHGNDGKINLTEVAVAGALGVIPGASQGALKSIAASSGLGGNVGNTVGSLALVAKLKLAASAAGRGISSALPEKNIDISEFYENWKGDMTTSSEKSDADEMRKK